MGHKWLHKCEFLEAVASLGLVVSLSQSVTESVCHGVSLSRFSDIRKKELLIHPKSQAGLLQFTTDQLCCPTILSKI